MGVAETLESYAIPMGYANAVQAAKRREKKFYVLTNVFEITNR
jgi:hypothetical protein